MPQELYTQRVQNIEKYLQSLYPNFNSDIDKTPFVPALNYTLLAGGKRLRPVLCLTFSALCADITKKAYSEEDILPFASAIEMIHTYSLIHDDLPAMDDDDLRRGKPTCHKVYDEATAILVGDALLSDAFEVATRTNIQAQYLLPAINSLALAIGSKGMVGGQILDMSMAGFFEENIDSLAFMNARKTGDLLNISCLSGGILYNADLAVCEAINLFGRNFGIAFQISDDILDIIGDTAVMGKPQGSDTHEEKSTWVSMLGLEKAKLRVQQHIEQCQDALNLLQNFTFKENKNINILSNLTTQLITRQK